MRAHRAANSLDFVNAELPNTTRGPRVNRADLVMVTVAGQAAHPVGQKNAYRIGYDGVPRVLPGTGGIVINHRIGDRCVGLAGDHVEPGVALHNNTREVVGPRDGPNNALITYACVGNRVRIVSGPCSGKMGLVTGKHGGINHVLTDFPTSVLMQMQIGDRVQIYSCGLGMRLLDYDDIEVMNCAPGLLRRWGIQERDNRLFVPVTHKIPSALMGSGLGKNTIWRGDYDIQLADPIMRRRYGLGSLRFGDMVAITDSDNRRGPSLSAGRTSIGVIVHGDSTVSGHGPGVTVLLTGPAHRLRVVHRPHANLANIYNVRRACTARHYAPLASRHRVTAQLSSAVHPLPSSCACPHRHKR